MGEPAMDLSQSQLEQIGKYVSSHLDEWMVNANPSFSLFSLNERQIRVEEELKNQRELIRQGFEYTEKRIEQVDKRIEETRLYTERQFEQMDKRIDQMDKRIEQVNKRFEQVDKRFEQVDKRFEQVDKRFEDMQSFMNRRFNSLQWGIGLAVTLLSVMMTLYQFLN